MNNFSIRNLPIDSTNFEVLRKQNKIYIDKTDLIFEFAQDDAPIFLSRPRRFGKSLLTTTIKSLFEHGLEYFEGLKISKLWNDTTYPVLYLNFSNYKENDYDFFYKSLTEDIKDFIEKYELISDIKYKNIFDPSYFCRLFDAK